MQLSQKKFKLPFYSGTEVQRGHFFGTCKRQKIEEHVVTALDVRNDNSRPSSTSCAAAEERQKVSFKNTIDELSDAFAVGKDVGLWCSGNRATTRKSTKSKGTASTGKSRRTRQKYLT